jgi:hypothetical protein
MIRSADGEDLQPLPISVDRIAASPAEEEVGTAAGMAAEGDGIPVNPIKAIAAVDRIATTAGGARDGGRVAKDEIIASQAKQTIASPERAREEALEISIDLVSELRANPRIVKSAPDDLSHEFLPFAGDSKLAVATYS